MHYARINALTFHHNFVAPPQCQHFLVCGADAFLRQEMVAALTPLTGARHCRMELSAQTDWALLQHNIRTPALFDPLLVCTLSLPDKKLTKTQVQGLLPLAESVPNVLLILTTPYQQLLQEAWWAAFAPHTLVIRCAPPTASEMPPWIMRRAECFGLVLAPDLCAALHDLYEEQLASVTLWLEQAAQRHPAGTVTLEVAQPWLPAQRAPVSLTQWLHAVMSGDRGRALTLLQQLQRQQTPPLKMIRTLQPYVLTLLSAQRRLRSADNSALQRHIGPVWNPHRGRFNPLDLAVEEAVKLLMTLELSMKWHPTLEPWSALADSVLLLTSATLRGRGLLHPLQ